MAVSPSPIAPVVPVLALVLPVVHDADAFAAELEADATNPIVAYVLPRTAQHKREVVCPACALENGFVLDEEFVAVRASEFDADEDECDKYESGRVCVYCATPFPGYNVSPRRCFCAIHSDGVL